MQPHSAHAEVPQDRGREVTVVGAGNWFLSHDRVGPLVLEQARGLFGMEVELVDIGAGGLALLDHLRGQGLFIVVDACVGKGAPGSVLLVEPDLENVEGGATSVHQIGPVEALAVAKALWPERMPARLRLLLVETSEIDDERLHAACDEAVTLLGREIEKWREDSDTITSQEQDL